MKTLKERVFNYLEDQKQYYGNNEIDENLKILEVQKEDLSEIDSLSKILILRHIDDNDLYYAINSLNND